jgi:tetratricopeptide (TPR) repeat protein
VDGIGNLAVGKAERAEQVLRESLEALEQMGEKGYLSSIAYYLADALLRQGRFEEAEELTRVSEATTAPDDIASLVGWRRTRALVLAERDEFDEAELLLGEALELASRSDSLMQTAEVALALATMHEKMSRTDQATAEAERAADLFARKGMETSTARAKALIVSL